MAARCPRCHSRHLRRAHRQWRLEHLLSCCGIYPSRCGVCSYRFFKAINWGGGSSKPIARKSELATAVPLGSSLTASDGPSLGRTGSAVHVIVVLTLVLSMVIVSLLIAAWPSQATLYMR